MARITRNSYQRKIILFGVMMFSAVALISSGFAAWVLSTEQKQSVNGNASVAAVSDASFNLSVAFKDGKNNIIFDSAKDDETGRVRWDSTNYAITSVTITGQIENYDYLGTLKVSLAVTDAIKDAANDTNKYIVLPACATSPVDIKNNTYMTKISDENGGTYSFEYTIEFTWGDTFGNTNPSLYYDTPAATSIDDATMKATLEAFYALCGATNAYTITVTATAK